ncbi:MAG: Maf family nucleotide pyrophosphatase [Hyphomicrobiales bacterium]
MSDERVKLVLASGSPRRLALLEQAGLTPDLLNPTMVDELPRKNEAARKLAKRLARSKAEAAIHARQVKDLGESRFVVAADTVVSVGRRIIPKPESIDEAHAALKLLSGRAHRVSTGVCIATPRNKFRERVVETKVRFKRLSREDIETYLMSGEWRDKAGGYAIQGRADAFVRTINGSYSNVVGLPLYEVVTLLHGAGFPVYFNWSNPSK